MKRNSGWKVGCALFLTMAFLFLVSGSAYAAMGEVAEFSLLSEKDLDYVGSVTPIKKNGTADAGFSLAIRGSGAITRIILIEEKSGKRWDTNLPSGHMPLGVCNDQGTLLNAAGELPVIGFFLGTRLTIWVDNRTKLLASDGKYNVEVYFMDKSVAKGSLTLKGEGQSDTDKDSAGASGKPGSLRVTTVKYLGQTESDFVGASVVRKKIASNGKNDFGIELKVTGSGTITGFRVHNTAGLAGTWDTFPDSNNPLLAVMSDGSITLPKIFNRENGTVSIAIDGEMTFNLLVEDENNTLADPRTESVVSVYMGDKVTETNLTKVTPPKDSSFAASSFEYTGRGKYDFVGNSSKLASNLVPDMELVLGLDAVGTIWGIRITGYWLEKGNKIVKTWDTLGGTNAAIAVTRADGTLLNSKTGSIALPVKGKETLYLRIDNETEPGPEATFRVDVTFSDGRILKSVWEEEDEGDVSSGQEIERGIRLISRPTTLSSGMVNKGESPAPGAKNNASLIVRVTGKGEIQRMSLINQSGAGSWDTNPGNKIPLLGVRQKGRLENKNDGTIRIAVNNSADLELIVLDNGSVKKSGARFMLNIAWKDGELTRQVLTW